ncbi:Fur family transcriptional regulator [Leifsonia sp. A12D58]|uniref:Fur family transcriptional regulator n=1 Tax=Leifsonia sp. A12D58 TaxID=3397674 RepID=UPI0039E16505
MKPEPADAIATALDQLRSRGERITDARRAVIETLAHLGDHPSAEQLSTSVQETHPSVHRATIYRTLDTLTALGVATHVHVSGGASAYHLASSTHRDHLHASCLACGRIVDLPGDLLDPVVSRLSNEGLFLLDPSMVALAGTCEDCLAVRAPS